jgi:PrcB C-terminal
MTRALTLLGLTLTLFAVGCGGSGSRSSSTAAGVTSSGTTTTTTSLAFRSLERGAQTGVVNTPPDAFATQVVTSDADLDLLWQAHGSSAARPTVDFSQERVAALFLGERPTNGYGIEVVGVAEINSGTGVEVSYVRTSPAPGQLGTPAVTQPFDLVAINDTQRALSFVDVTPAPVTRPLAGVHGELVDTPTMAGSTSLAFLPDGASEALEIVDTAALVAAGAHAGWTLVLDGDAQANVGGASALLEALAVVTFDLDTVFTSGEMFTLRTLVPPSPVVFNDVDGTTWEPVGPLAAAMLASPGGVPLAVTGRLDPTPGVNGQRLIVTSWRSATRLSFSDVMPLLSSDGVWIDDLDQRGTYRVDGFTAVGPGGQTTRGRGRRLAPSVLADLQQFVTAADLRNHPAVYQPAQIYPDHPSVSVTLSDAQGDVRVTVYGGARGVPAGLTALIQHLRSFPAAVPTFRSLEQGDTSQVIAAGAEVARDATEFGALYARHRPGTRGPAVDFTQDVVVAAFDGQRPTGGYAIAFVRAEQIGAAIYLTTRSTAPRGGAPSVLTAPYHLVTLTRPAGPILVDGQAR